jgi:hypothetical protein
MRTFAQSLADGRPARHAASLFSLVLVALLAGLLLCDVAPAGTSIAAPSPSPCLGHPASQCAGTAASADEGQEDEEEHEEGGGEDEGAGATTEASDEEAGSKGSPSNHPSGPSSNSGATSPSSGKSAVALSRLSLTPATAAALRQGHRPFTSAIRFSFTLSAPAKVRVMLVKQTSAAGGGRAGRARNKHWAPLQHTLTLNARGGRVQRGLTGHSRLSPGRYRLTVKPQAGSSRSIYLLAR